MYIVGHSCITMYIVRCLIHINNCTYSITHIYYTYTVHYRYHGSRVLCRVTDRYDRRAKYDHTRAVDNNGGYSMLISYDTIYE